MGSSINTTYITINGGASNDVLRSSNLLTDGTFPGYNFTINGLEGDDTLFASDGPFNWPTYGLAHPTEILQVHSSLVGGAGNDRMYSAAGFANLDPSIAANYSHSAYMMGGDGDDLYVLRGAQCTISELSNVGSGNDTVLLTTAYATATGSGTFDLGNFANVENIRVQAGVGNTTLSGNASNNNIVDNAGNGSISGGLGDDTLIGQTGNDTLTGDGGNDDLRGGTGQDQLFGGEGNNLLYGGVDNDTLSAGTGNDLLNGGLGDDSMSGGDGVDTLIGADGNDSLLGEAGTDNLSAGAGNDQLFGGDGNDLMYGGADADTITGGLGNDVLMGGLGVDDLAGGDGDDSYGVSSYDDLVTENAAEGSDTVTSGIVNLDDFYFENVETLQLTGTADLSLAGSTATTLIGNDGNNIITAEATTGTLVSAGAGNDNITGSSSGADRLYGGDGDDFMSFYNGSGTKILDGGAGNDSLNGGAGNDFIYGGSGSDYLDGAGGGVDTFVFASSEYSATANSYEAVIDSIGSFAQGTDKIDLTGFGSLVATFAPNLGIIHFSMTNGGEIVAVVNESKLNIDINGDAIIDGVISLVGVDVMTLTSADFYYIDGTS